MHRIGLLSDTHSFIHEKVFDFFKDCGEIWHAGDIGNLVTAEQLNRFKPLKAVYGNIDGQDVRLVYPKTTVFTIEGMKIVMTHIGGFPNRYDGYSKDLILREHPDIFVCGHSHILKIIYDKKLQHLHINPGAAGHFGLHKSITMVRFTIDGKQLRDMEILDIPR